MTDNFPALFYSQIRLFYSIFYHSFFCKIGFNLLYKKRSGQYANCTYVFTHSIVKSATKVLTGQGFSEIICLDWKFCHWRKLPTFPTARLPGFAAGGTGHYNMCFMHDDVPAHFSISACNHLDAIYPGRWIRHGEPVFWPPQSPELNSLDFFFWSHLKSLVYKKPMDKLEDLTPWIIVASEDIASNPGMFEHIWQSCVHWCQLCNDLCGCNFEPKNIYISAPPFLCSTVMNLLCCNPALCQINVYFC